jgi:hypothetical protein
VIDFFDWLDDFERTLKNMKGDCCNENRQGEENQSRLHSPDGINFPQ